MAWGKWERERDQSLSMSFCHSLGAGVPWYVITQLRSCPIERLGKYLNDTCSHHSHFSSVLLTSVDYFSWVLQFSTELKSLQLPVSLYNFYGHCHIVSRWVFVWSLGIIVRNIHWIKVVQVLNHCSVEISFCRLLLIWIDWLFNEGMIHVLTQTVYTNSGANISPSNRIEHEPFGMFLPPGINYRPGKRTFVSSLRDVWYYKTRYLWKTLTMRCDPQLHHQTRW